MRGGLTGLAEVGFSDFGAQEQRGRMRPNPAKECDPFRLGSRPAHEGGPDLQAAGLLQPGEVASRHESETIGQALTAQYL